MSTVRSTALTASRSPGWENAQGQSGLQTFLDVCAFRIHGLEGLVARWKRAFLPSTPRKALSFRLVREDLDVLSKTCSLVCVQCIE